LHIKKSALHLVLVTRKNPSPALAFELLNRIARTIRDYLGVLSEESLRKNYVLVYEMLDEMLDNGCIQTTSAEALKMFIGNEPVEVSPSEAKGLTFSVSYHNFDFLICANTTTIAGGFQGESKRCFKETHYEKKERNLCRYA